MASVFLLLVLLPVMFYIWIGTIVSLFKKPKDKKNQSYHIDSRAKVHTQREPNDVKDKNSTSFAMTAHTSASNTLADAVDDADPHSNYQYHNSNLQYFF